MERQESERTKRNRLIQGLVSMLMKLLCQSKKKPESPSMPKSILKLPKRADIID